MHLPAIALDRRGFVVDVNAAADTVFDNDVNIKVPVQSFGSDLIKALRTRTGSGSENCIPDCGRPVVFVPKFAEVELTFPDPMYEFNTGDGG